MGLRINVVLAVFAACAIGQRATAHEHHHVPTDYPTLQAAINAAHATDEIEVEPGTYSGPGFRDLDLQGKWLTIVGIGGPDSVTIDLGGSPEEPHRFISSFGNNVGAAGVLISMTIRGGYAEEGGVVRTDGGGVLTAVNCKFVDNHAVEGGVFWVQNSQVFIDRCTFDSCGATRGGAIHFDAECTGFVTGSRFDACTATADGGAITFTTGHVTSTNCIFHDNSAGTNGGAISSAGGVFEVFSATACANRAVSGGAIYADGGSLRVANSIVRDNLAPASSQIGGSPVVLHCNVDGGFDGDGNFDADPLFIDGPGGNFRLQAGSACIDAGVAGELPPHIGFDFDRNPRTVDGDMNGTATIDVGAFEVQVPCDADWNHEGGVTSQDFFAFIVDFFGGDADFNGDLTTNSQDFFDFLAAFFVGC